MNDLEGNKANVKEKLKRSSKHEAKEIASCRAKNVKLRDGLTLH